MLAFATLQAIQIAATLLASGSGIQASAFGGWL